MNLRNLLAVNAKFVTALVVGAVVFGLKQLNLEVDQDFIDALGVVVLAVLVWLVPNKKGK